MTSGSKEGPSRLLNMALDQVNSNSREINKKSRYHDRRKPYNNDRRRVNYRDRSRDRSSRDRYNSSSHRDRYSRKYILKVSNLDHTITREHLKELFSEVGEVEKTWIDYDRTARSKGTGGCIFKSSSDGEKAVSRFDGHEIDGRIMEVKGEYQDMSASRPKFKANRRNNHCVRAPW